MYNDAVFFDACRVPLYTQALCQAAVKLPGFFGDHMVLQQESELPSMGLVRSG